MPHRVPFPIQLAQMEMIFERYTLNGAESLSTWLPSSPKDSVKENHSLLFTYLLLLLRNKCFLWAVLQQWWAYINRYS